MLNLYYAYCVAKVACRRLLCQKRFFSWTFLHEIELEFLRGFCPVRNCEDLFRKREFLESLVTVTDIRNGLKFLDFRHEHLQITEIAWRTGSHENVFAPSILFLFLLCNILFYCAHYSPPAPNRTLLYFHGGSYCFGSIETHQEFCSALTKLLGCTTYVVNYRLAPEHPYPAAFEDAKLSYTWLRTHLQKKPNEIIVAGDCAGGGLALSLCLWLKSIHSDQPRGLILLSPLVNNKFTLATTPTTQSHYTIDTWDIFSVAEDCLFSSLYCKNESPEHPYISPVFGDLNGLPPILVQIGSVETRRNATVEFVQKAMSQGVPITFEIYDNEVRCFHMIEDSAHSNLAMAKIKHFVMKLYCDNQYNISQDNNNNNKSSSKDTKN